MIHLHAGASGMHGAIAGTVYAWLSFVLPDDVISFGWKLALALPLGLLTGAGTAFGSMLVKRWFAARDAKRAASAANSKRLGSKHE